MKKTEMKIVKSDGVVMRLSADIRTDRNNFFSDMESNFLPYIEDGDTIESIYFHEEETC